MTRHLQGAAPALTAGAVAAALILGGCASGGDYTPMGYAQDCQGPDGRRAPDDYCDTARPGFAQVWDPIYDDGSYDPPIGYPMVGWTRVRPVGVTQTNVIIHTAPTGGSMTRTGTGTAVASTSTLGSGGRIPTAPAGFTSTSSGRTDSASGKGLGSGTTGSSYAGSGTVTRGVLGAKGSSGDSAGS